MRVRRIFFFGKEIQKVRETMYTLLIYGAVLHRKSCEFPRESYCIALRSHLIKLGKLSRVRCVLLIPSFSVRSVKDLVGNLGLFLFFTNIHASGLTDIRHNSEFSKIFVVSLHPPLFSRAGWSIFYTSKVAFHILQLYVTNNASLYASFRILTYSCCTKFIAWEFEQKIWRLTKWNF